MGINSPSNSHHITRGDFCGRKTNAQFLQLSRKAWNHLQVVHYLWNGGTIFTHFGKMPIYCLYRKHLICAKLHFNFLTHLGEYAYFYLFPKHFPCSQIPWVASRRTFLTPNMFHLSRDASPEMAPEIFRVKIGALVNYFHFHRMTAFYWCIYQ